MKSFYEENNGDEMEYGEFAAACDDWDDWATEELPWTDEDEAGLEEYEERKRQRIAEANEY